MKIKDLPKVGLMGSATIYLSAPQDGAGGMRGGNQIITEFQKY